MSIEKRFSLKDRVIVVTGATGILGAAFVKGLAQAGAKVVIIGRNQQRAAERAESVKEHGSEALVIRGDVLDEEQMKSAKDQVIATFGRIDGLVNAAGGNISGATIGPDDNLFDTSIADTRKAVDLNLFGTVIPTQVFGQYMAEKGVGSIVNISSLAGQNPITRVLGYTMAKFAIEGYTRWMAVELAQRYGDKVRVNAIAPGVFLTEQNRTLLTNEDGSFTDRANKFVRNTPFNRLGDPEELIGTLIYLLSDASGFVTGETILVDGGFNSWTGV